MSDNIQAQFWGHQIDEVMTEIAREAAICQVRPPRPRRHRGGAAAGNASVCGNDNPRAFKKMRELLMMGFVSAREGVRQAGPVEADALVSAIREKLKAASSATGRRRFRS